MKQLAVIFAVVGAIVVLVVGTAIFGYFQLFGSNGIISSKLEMATTFARDATRSFVQEWDAVELAKKASRDFAIALRSHGSVANAAWFADRFHPPVIVGQCSVETFEFTNGSGWVEILCPVTMDNHQVKAVVTLVTASDDWELTNFVLRLSIVSTSFSNSQFAQYWIDSCYRERRHVDNKVADTKKFRLGTIARQVIAEVGGPIDKCGLSLCIFGDDFVPEEVTRPLGTNRKRSGKKA